jgi:hypothetical protein
MRNLLLLQDSIFNNLLNHKKNKSNIVSICRDIGSTSLFALSQHGLLLYLDTSDCLKVEDELLLNGTDPDDISWFNVTVVAETGAVVCVSHSGLIVSIKEDPQTGRRSKVVEQEGDVEGGIAAACWNPDTSNLIVITNNDTILLMTGYWDVLEEVSLPSRLADSPCSVSWRGDGEYLTILTTDKEDSIPHVRVYSKTLDLISTGRNIADGPASILRGLQPVVAYATNGSLIALALSPTRGKTKQQVAFIEKNGLRHLEFDIQCPPIPEGCQDWEVSSLHWDLPSTLLAVGLTTINNLGNKVGAIQLYYRGNYHWYLKQQWTSLGLVCLGFDTETVGRLFMVQSSDENMDFFSKTESKGSTALRMVDLVWDVCVSGSNDGSIAVVDGSNILLTPLAINTVPPPMSMYKQLLQGPCKHAFFFPRAFHKEGWGLACLCDGDLIRVVFGDCKGMPTRHMDVDLASVLKVMKSTYANTQFIFRGIAATEVGDIGDDLLEGTVAIVLYGSRAKGSRVDNDRDYEGVADELLILHVGEADGVLKKTTWNYGLHKTSDDISDVDSGDNVDSGDIDCVSVSRIALWPGDGSSLAVGIISSSISFDVYRVNIKEIQPDDGCLEGGIQLSKRRGLHVYIRQEYPITFPESCVQISVIPAEVPAESDGATLEKGDFTVQTEGIDLVVGLTSRGKLYCGETLLVAGVSSYAVNTPLGVLMYVSTGTRPLLHFCSFAALRLLDPLRGEAWEDQQAAAAMPGAEPRPVERGARLVLAPSGSPRVILQMPRGNIEGFEPRPLILLKARELVDSSLIYDCLLLLRRQKVDLNYLIDYNPTIFLKEISKLVEICLQKNPDLLSLLISSLEPGDVTLFKYPTFRPSLFEENEIQELPKNGDFFDGNNKVNIVCTTIRNALLPYLKGNISTNMYTCRWIYTLILVYKS